MWLLIKKFILRFINKGTGHYDTFDDQKRVRLINFLAFLLMLFLFPVAAIHKTLNGYYWELLVVALFFLLCLLAMFLNQSGRNQIAALVCIIPTILITYFVVFNIDRQTGAPYINLYVGLGAFYLIRNALLKNVLASMGFLSFLITNYYQLSHLPFVKADYLLVVMILLLIYIAFWHFESEINNSRIQIAKQNERLVELNREKDGMLGIVAHDLRSPFNQIKGLISLMSHTLTTKMEQDDLINRINNSIDQANHLISDLLDINNFQQHNIKLNAQHFSLNEFLKALQDNFEPLANKKQQQLYCSTNVKSDINTDRLLLTRVMENLVSNAIKFAPPRTTVHVTIGQEDNTFRFSVKDEGPGFTSDDKVKMFGPFQKLSAIPTGDEKSIGLGLSIVKSIVETLQGSITLYSKPAEGSEFVVTLPVSHKNGKQYIETTNNIAL